MQNGNAYEEGIKEFLDPIKKYWKDKTVENGKALEGFHSPKGLKWQYTHGVRDVEKISPDNWHVDLQHLSRREKMRFSLLCFMTIAPIFLYIQSGKLISANINRRR